MQTLCADTADIILQTLGKDSTLLSKVRGAVGPVCHTEHRSDAAAGYQRGRNDRI